MENLWAFLLQTLTASGAAALLLLVKALFRDKLPPRWQFSVWGILGVLLLLPAGRFGRHILVDWPLWIDTVKAALFGITEPTRVYAPFPLLSGARPESFADWLFLAYLAGVVFFAVRYVLGYVRLRRILRSGTACSDLPELREVEQRYGLPRCRAVRVEGLSSAFVCGVLHPVLALPADRETDRKVLLHELLHLRHRDVIWGVVISCFRCIHWCNPLLWYCADQAMNDMETLCDQRVLEHLEGEDRREYGRILLSMANETYARAPGTSSMANGGSNIRRRIEAIARFRRYPAGMGLVSVCIVLMLVSPLLFGSETQAQAWQQSDSSFRLIRSLTAARQMPCTTFGGAADAYAKALLTGKAADRMMCLDGDAQQTLLREALEAPPVLWEPELPEPVYPDGGYTLCNPRRLSPDRIETLLILQTVRRSEQPGFLRLCVQTISLCREQDRWAAEPLEPFRILEIPDETDLRFGSEALPAQLYRGESPDFRVELYLQRIIPAESWVQAPSHPMSPFEHPPRFDLVPDPDLEFTCVQELRWQTLIYQGDPARKDAIFQLGLSVDEWNPEKPRPELHRGDLPQSGGTGAGGSWRSWELHPGWENPICIGGSGGNRTPEEAEFDWPEQFAADLWINREKAAELTLRKEEQP